ncbi:hypothetical protein IC582_021144 [Cucumis melo]
MVQLKSCRCDTYGITRLNLFFHGLTRFSKYKYVIFVEISSILPSIKDCCELAEL